MPRSRSIFRASRAPAPLWPRELMLPSSSTVVAGLPLSCSSAAAIKVSLSAWGSPAQRECSQAAEAPFAYGAIRSPQHGHPLSWMQPAICWHPVLGFSPGNGGFYRGERFHTPSSAQNVDSLFEKVRHHRLLLTMNAELDLFGELRAVLMGDGIVSRQWSSMVRYRQFKGCLRVETRLLNRKSSEECCFQHK